MRKTRTFHDYLIASLQNPKEAAAYLNVALEEYQKDNDAEAFVLALCDIMQAQNKPTSQLKTLL